MTKRREPLTYHRTLTIVAGAIGWDRCAAICGVSERTVRLWSDPDCETEIRMIDAERLDRAFIEHGGDHGPFLRLMQLRVEMATHHTCPVDLLRSAAVAAKESGEAISALVEATGASNPATLRRARLESEEAIASLTDALVALERRQGVQ